MSRFVKLSIGSSGSAVMAVGIAVMATDPIGYVVPALLLIAAAGYAREAVNERRAQQESAQRTG